MQDRIYAIEAEQEHAAAEAKARVQKEAEEKAQQKVAQQRREQEMQQQMQKEQSEALLRRLKREWAVYYCTVGNVGQVGLGCNVDEANGANGQHWIHPGISAITSVVPGDGTIVFSLYNRRIVGIPNGGRIEDLSWQCTRDDGSTISLRPGSAGQGWVKTVTRPTSLDLMFTCDVRSGDNEERHTYFWFSCNGC